LILANADWVTIDLQTAQTSSPTFRPSNWTAPDDAQATTLTIATYKEPTMNDADRGKDKSRGELRIELLFTSSEIGVSVPEPHPMRAIRIFLDIASDTDYRAIAPRLTQMPKGVLLFQMVADEPGTGAIYILIRDSGEFYAVTFEGPSDNLTIPEFESLVREYGLLEYAAQPQLIEALAATAPQA
jgi:hypothetical protein